MAVILIKRSDSDGKPADGNLARGELAYAFGNGTDTNEGQRLFVGVPNGGTSRTAIIGGEYFANFLDHAPGTLTASSAIITDASNKIDQLKVDLLTLDSNVISTESGNLVLSSNTGIVELGNLEFENNEIRTNSNSQTLILNPYPTTDSGTVIIKGDLRVDGTTTTVNSTEVTINDLAIVVGDSGGTVPLEFDGAGIIVFSAESNSVFGTTSPSITYNGTTDRWDFSRAIDVDSAYIDNIVSTQVSITNLTVTDSATIADATVTGTATINNADITTLDVSDSATIVDANITGTATINQATVTTLDVTDSATIVDANITGTATIAVLDVTDSATINQATVTTLDVTDSATIVDLTVSNQTNLTNASITDLTVTDSATINFASISNMTFTDSALSQFLDSDDFIFSGGQASLKAEAVEDIVGAMVSGNTETNISVTYQDADGTIDFEVPTASTAQVGVAQFDSDNFDVVAGYVTIDTVDGGTY